MNYEEFCSALQEELFNRLDSGYAIHRERILKNNGVILDSLTLLKAGKHCSPVIPLEMLYEQFEDGSSLSELCDYIESITNSAIPPAVSRIRSLNCFEDLKDRITCRIISCEKNEEFLRTVPWLPYLDLAIIFSLSIQSEGETQISTVITHTVSDSWNVTPEELFEIAMENTPWIHPSLFRRLETVVEEYFPGATLFLPPDVPVPTLYVFTNETAHYGAATILYPNALKDLAEQFGSDLLILPSSIHEVLIIADSENFSEHDYQIFRNTIRHVNDEAILPEDFLSDNLYRYHRASEQLEIFSETP